MDTSLHGLTVSREPIIANMPRAERVWIGMGTWLFAEQPERAIAQIHLAREAGIAGEALFSYDSIAAAPQLREALIREMQLER